VHAGTAGAASENAAAAEEAHGGGSVGGGKKKKIEWRKVPFSKEHSIQARIKISASEVMWHSQVPRSGGATALVSLGTRALTEGDQLPSREDMVASLSGNLKSCARILDHIVAPTVNKDEAKKKRKDAHNDIRSFIHSTGANLRGWVRLNLQLAVAHAYLRESSDGIKFMALVNKAENVAVVYEDVEGTYASLIEDQRLASSCVQDHVFVSAAVPLMGENAPHFHVAEQQLNASHLPRHIHNLVLELERATRDGNSLHFSLLVLDLGGKG
jgi:hypothetical protein